MSPQATQENHQPTPPNNMNREEELKFLVGQLGEFGKYQLFQHILHLLVWLVAGIHLMEFVFVFPIMEHRCYIPEIDGHSSSESSVGSYIPTTASGDLASCFKFKVPNQDNSTVSCGEDGYFYSSDYYASSRVLEWDMVCDREWMRALLQTIFILGALIGAFIGGALGDKFGRKPVLCWSGVLSFLCGLGAVFSDNYYVATVFMLLYGVFGSGAGNVASLALTMELVGPTKRPLCGSTITFVFGSGGIVVAGIAYFLPVNARILHLIYVCLSMVLFAHWWLVDESISWLWSQGKYDEAVKILEKAAKINGIELTFPEGFQSSSTDTQNSGTQNVSKMKDKHGPKTESGIMAVFRTPEIRKRSLVMMYTWFAGGMLYFGLSFNSVNLFGNPFLIFIITCLAEFPSHPITIFFTPKFGYKPIIFISTLLPGIACVVLAFISRDIISTSIAMLAKVAATAFYNIATAYTPELFPTVIRNTAVGLCIMTTRVGASLIPQINMLSGISDKLPNLIFGGVGILASIGILLFLPETLYKPIPQTIEEVENYKKCNDMEKQFPDNNVEILGFSNIAYKNNE